MRTPRSLKREVENVEERKISKASEAVARYLMLNLPQEDRELIKSYVEKHGEDWWRRLDLDTGGLLGDEFRKYGYTETFLGQHELQPMFKDILAKAVIR